MILFFINILYLFFAIYLFLCLATYDAFDPSYYLTADYLPNNFFSYFGAFVSDFLLQMFGIISFLIPIFLIFKFLFFFFSNFSYFIYKKFIEICILINLILYSLIQYIDISILHNLALLHYKIFGVLIILISQKTNIIFNYIGFSSGNIFQILLIIFLYKKYTSFSLKRSLINKDLFFFNLELFKKFLPNFIFQLINKKVKNKNQEQSDKYNNQYNKYDNINQNNANNAIKLNQDFNKESSINNQFINNLNKKTINKINNQVIPNNLLSYKVKKINLDSFDVSTDNNNDNSNYLNDNYHKNHLNYNNINFKYNDNNTNKNALDNKETSLDNEDFLLDNKYNSLDNDQVSKVKTKKILNFLFNKNNKKIDHINNLDYISNNDFKQFDNARTNLFTDIIKKNKISSEQNQDSLFKKKYNDNQYLDNIERSTDQHKKEDHNNYDNSQNNTITQGQLSQNDISSIQNDNLKQENSVQNTIKVQTLLEGFSQNTIKTQDWSNFQYPSLDLLEETKAKFKPQTIEELQLNAAKLLKVLNDFGVSGAVVDFYQGPVITLYEFEPSPGIKSSRIIGLADDIARSLSAISTRIALIPGKNVLGIEIPNANRSFFNVKELMEYLIINCKEMSLPIILGKNYLGEPLVMDLAKMPHLLVAGTTGSGKSVGINTMIFSLLFRYSPDECKFIMIDPKMLELSVYSNIPHLLTPVVTDAKKAVSALKWAVKEMESRYKMMANIGARNIYNYNTKIKESNLEIFQQKIQIGFDENQNPIYDTKKTQHKKMPFIVIIIDEMADLMIVAGKDIENLVQRLAQMARAAGIHIVMATQRPSVDIITGVIKANFPSRLSFKVISKIDSRTILGQMGGEQLLGMGDMLYLGGNSQTLRAHGPFIDDSEVDKLVSFLKSQGEPDYISDIIKDDILEIKEEKISKKQINENQDTEDLYYQAIDIVRRDKKASISYIQRILKISYSKAAILIAKMEEEGIISAPNIAGKREILEG